MLSENQIRAFDTFGFLVLKQAFSPDEMDSIRQEAWSLWEQELGRRPDESEHVHIGEFVEKRERLTELVVDDRIHQPMMQLMGDDFIWSGSEGNISVQTGKESHHWHADRFGEQEVNYLRIKIMLYLVPMRKENGALRLIPGSHRSPMHEQLEPFVRRHGEDCPDFFGMTGQEVPSFIAETDPGDVLIFNHCLFHAVYLSNRRRSYIAMKFAARPTCDENLASLTKWSPYALRPHEAFRNSKTKKLQRMLEGLDELSERAEALAGE